MSLAAHIHPYHYPSTVVLVDDSRRFIQNFSFHLDPLLSLKCFQSAEEAMGFLKSHARFIGDGRGRFLKEDQELGERALQGVNRLSHLVSDPQRFTEVSVVLVDYDMPGIDGLELCRSLQGSAVKRILFTSDADVELVVQAFNEGIIERYISKSDPDRIHQIGQAIRCLQDAYFDQISDQVVDALAVDRPDFLNDVRFAEFFSSLCSQYGFVEHYLQEQPRGLMLLDAHGGMAQLLVASAHELESHYQRALAADAPEPLLQGLKERSLIPGYWDSGSGCDWAYPVWQDYVYPAQRFVGSEGVYYWHLEIDAAHMPSDRENVLSYYAYLNQSEGRRN